MQKRTVSTRARCKTKSKQRMSDNARSTKFGDLISADNKILNVGSEWRGGHRNALIFQDDHTSWIAKGTGSSRRVQNRRRRVREGLEPANRAITLVVWVAAPEEVGSATRIRNAVQIAKTPQGLLP